MAKDLDIATLLITLLIYLVDSLLQWNELDNNNYLSKFFLKLI